MLSDHAPHCASRAMFVCDCRATPPIPATIAARRKLDERAPAELRRAGLAIHAEELDKRLRWEATTRARARAKRAA